MSNRDYRMFLQDIFDSAAKIEQYTYTMDFDSFQHNQMAADAVIRNFEIIGEASTHIPDAIKLKYPSIPWNKMKAIRNIVIHAYFGIDYETLWETIKTSLPLLKEEIANIISLENTKEL
ncbi:MAG: DUF86 domain-containing protein [Nitrospirae bacterium]|nr:DUF86 domain-containing protein [Nitrospirota bacterium]